MLSLSPTHSTPKLKIYGYYSLTLTIQLTLRQRQYGDAIIATANGPSAMSMNMTPARWRFTNALRRAIPAIKAGIMAYKDGQEQGKIKQRLSPDRSHHKVWLGQACYLAPARNTKYGYRIGQYLGQSLAMRQQEQWQSESDEQGATALSIQCTLNQERTNALG